METLGQYLKRERELRGISLEEIAKHTKYHMTNIIALEEDEHDPLPAPPYVKGMLRSISKYLGLDETEILLRYQDFLNLKKSESVSPKIGVPKIPFYKRKYLLTLSATFVFLLLAVVFIILFRKTGHIEPISEIPIVSTSDKDAVDSAVDAMAVNHALWMKASKRIWLKIQVDSDSPYSLYLGEGKTVEIKAKKVIRFFVSDAGMLKLIFNNKEVPNESEGPKTLIFPRHSVEKSPDTRRPRSGD